MPITNGLRNCTRCHREGRLTNSRIKIPKQPYGKGLEGSIILQEHAYGSIRCRLSDTHPWRCRNQELALFSVSLCNSLIGPFPPSAVFSLCVLILDVCFVENHDMMLDVVYFLCHALLALRACAAAATTRTERDSTKRNLHLHHLRPRRAPSPAAYPRKTPQVPLAVHSSVLGLACFTYFNFWVVPLVMANIPSSASQKFNKTKDTNSSLPASNGAISISAPSPSLPSTALDT